ncbi:MAG: aryl-sulfate sulfotransferase [Bacteroidia bacterium]|nr:aryl-sulfate sulfotransferase [Bacteroidia bacterium]
MKKNFVALFWLNLTVCAASAQSFHDFNVTAYDTSSTGYYFFTPYTFSGYPNFPLGTQRSMILDSKGEVVYYRDLIQVFSGDFQIMENGNMSYCGNHKFYIMDSTFTIIDSIKPRNGILFDVHELRVLPNGHYLLFGTEDIHRNLSGYHMFLGNNSPGAVNGVIRAGVVEELDSAKNVVYEWRAIDHYNFEDVDEFFLNDTTLADWTHYNAIELDTDGNLLISSRHFNEITKISRTDSSIIWRWGGKNNQFTFINDSIGFLGQHDIRRLPNGHFTLWDNGRNDPFHPAAAKEYILDENAMTATLVWSYTEDDTVNSNSQGNVQRLPNGNTLISYGDFRERNIVFNVIDSTGNKKFEVSFPDTLVTYRTFNYPVLPWALPRPEITCKDTLGTYYLDAGPGHSSYIWSDGQTTRLIQAADTGDYYVYATVGSGGFIRSENFTVSDVADPCGILSSVQTRVTEKAIRIYPNPAQEIIHLEWTADMNDTREIKVFNAVGKMVYRETVSSGSSGVLLNTHGYNPGIYTVRAGNLTGRFVKQ